VEMQQGTVMPVATFGWFIRACWAGDGISGLSDGSHEHALRSLRVPLSGPTHRQALGTLDLSRMWNHLCASSETARALLA